jgi:hypothetical protein
MEGNAARAKALFTELRACMRRCEDVVSDMLGSDACKIKKIILHNHPRSIYEDAQIRLDLDELTKLMQKTLGEDYECGDPCS